MRLHDIGPAPGARKDKKRIGRGPGSGTGKTAGRGAKGQKSRSGHSRRWGYEGGQMPLVRRVPKRGFTNIFATDWVEVNVGRLAKLDSGSEVDPDVLAERGFIRRNETDRIKLLGKGEITIPLTVRVHAATEGAIRKIQQAGGQVEILGAAEER